MATATPTDLAASLRADIAAIEAKLAALPDWYRAEIAALVEADYEAEAEDTHCSECGQDWCLCDDAYDNALAPVRVSDLGEGWHRAEAA